MSPALGDTPTSAHHPDLNDEVATLSTKLINAINHQTTLDDTLSSTRQELDNSRETIRQLEDQIAQQREMLAGDVWVRRKTVEAEKTQLLSRVADEKKLRVEAEQATKKIELELENLTAALFEEANKMVISAKDEARKEHEALQRKNDQVKAQLADTESLLKSQQEQLAELKQVMEQMNSDRDDQTAQTVPSSPGFSKFDPKEEDSRLDGGLPSALSVPLSPSYPTSFTHLLQPILRTDLTSYNDFRDLIRTSKRCSANRVSSGSHVGLTALGIGLGSATANSSAVSQSNSPSNSSPQTPNTPASSISVNPSTPTIILPPLKDTKFYKRALAEDIEPTLRLDIAPGLSWLARRTVLTAVTDGSLVVEPVPTNTSSATMLKTQQYPCSLCGESKKDEEYLRTHRFRTSESQSAQRYPLCKYCLGRVRSTCDFLGFLRIVKDGHWRADDEDAEKAAWEESVRLREQMFWSRIGGGVVPTSPVPHAHSTIATSISYDNSPRISQEENQKPTEDEGKKEGTAEFSDESPDAPAALPEVKRESEEKEESAAPTNDVADSPSSRVVTPTPELALPAEDSPSGRRSSSQPSIPSSEEDAAARLSRTVPGSFAS